MASSFFSLIPGLSQSLFTITDADQGISILQNLKIIRVEIDSDSENADVPMQNTGNVDSATLTSISVVDTNTSKIIKPSIMRVQAIAPDQSTIDEMLYAFASTTSLYDIVSRGIVMNSACVTTIEITQGADMISACRVEITFEQATPPEAAGGFDPSMAPDQSTYGISVQSPTSLTSTVADLYNTVQSNIAQAL